MALVSLPSTRGTADVRLAFQTSGLDRAAELRADAAALAALLAGGAVLPVWRGRPLVINGEALAWLPADHPILAGAATVFLGRDSTTAWFAADITPSFSPEEGVPLPAGAFDAGAQAHPALPATHLFTELRSVMTRLSPRDGELAATARALIEWHRTHGFCAACGAASTMVQAGWQRRCPACGTMHFPRTDPVVIMLVTRGNRTLIGRTPGWPAGMYSCLAGFVEPGETVEAAVRREVAEESGIAIGQVTYIVSQPWPWPASLMLGCRAQALDEAIRLDPVELEDALWITKEEMAVVMDGRHPDIRAPRAGAIAHALIAGWLADLSD